MRPGSQPCLRYFRHGCEKRTLPYPRAWACRSSGTIHQISGELSVRVAARVGDYRHVLQGQNATRFTGSPSQAALRRGRHVETAGCLHVASTKAGHKGTRCGWNAAAQACISSNADAKLIDHSEISAIFGGLHVATARISFAAMDIHCCSDQSHCARPFQSPTTFAPACRGLGRDRVFSASRRIRSVHSTNVLDGL